MVEKMSIKNVSAWCREVTTKDVDVRYPPSLPPLRPADIFLDNMSHNRYILSTWIRQEKSSMFSFI